MRQRIKRNASSPAKEISWEGNLSLSINYGTISASVKADRERYVAKIIGETENIGARSFQQFLIKFIKSMEQAGEGGLIK